MLWLYVLFIGVSASGWWGRYEAPVAAAAAAGVVYSLTTADTFPVIGAALVGLGLAAMRRSVLPKFGESRNHRGDVG